MSKSFFRFKLLGATVLSAALVTTGLLVSVAPSGAATEATPATEPAPVASSSDQVPEGFVKQSNGAIVDPTTILAYRKTTTTPTQVSQRFSSTDSKKVHTKGTVALDRNTSSSRLVTVTVPKGTADEVMASMNASGLYEGVQLDGFVRIAATTPNYTNTPNDPWFVNPLGGIDASWGLKGGQGGSNFNQVWADLATAAPSSIAPIAVLDTGFDLTNADLVNSNVKAGWNVVDNNSDVSVCSDGGVHYSSHGTNTVGIIGAETDNRTYFAGAGYDATVKVYRISTPKYGCDGTTFRALIDGVNRAAQDGAKIINISFYITGYYPTALCDVISDATKAGALVVAASGNNGNMGNPVSFPAACSDALSVTNTDSTGTLGPTANTASNVAIAAPGTKVGVIYPYGGLGTESGTSISAPYVSAAASLLMRLVPTASMSQIRAALVGYGNPVTGAPRATYKILNVKKAYDALAKAAPSVSATPTSVILAPAAGSSTNVTVNAMGGWTARSNQSWLTVPASGTSPTSTVTLSAAANATTSTRTATVTFTSSNNNTSAVTVTQASEATALLALSSTSGKESSTGGTVNVTVAATGNWTASSNTPTWLTVSPASGTAGSKTATLTVSPNLGTSDRTGMVTFNASGSSVTYLLTQAVSPVLPSISTWNASGLLDSISITATGTENWTVTSNQSWLWASTDGGSPGNQAVVTLRVDTNTSGAIRHGEIIFTGSNGGGSYTISVTQAAAPPITLPSKGGGISSAGGSTSVSFFATENWKATSNQSWLTVLQPTSGTSNKNYQSINFTVSPNAGASARTAQVTFSTSGGDSTYTLTQAGQAAALPTVTLSSAIGSLGSATGTTSTTVNATGTWSAKSNQTWLTISPASGNSSPTTVRFTANANPTTYSRFAIVTFSTPGGIDTTYTLTQDAAAVLPTVSLSSPTGSVGSAGDSTTTTATATGAWSATSNQTWLTISPASGNSSPTTVRFTANANTSTDSRVATVTFTLAGGNRNTYALIQGAAAPTVTLSNSTGSVGSAGGNTSTIANATGTWSATSDQDWVTVSPAFGNTDFTPVTFKTQTNTTTSLRSAKVTFSTLGGTSATYTLTQAAGAAAAPKVTLSDPSGSIGSANGSTASITVSATGAWSAVSDQNWVTITPASGNGTALVTFSAQANTATTTRTAKITFTPQGGTSVTYTLTQNGATPTLTLTNPSGALTSAASYLSYTLTASVPWSASSNESWLTVSPSSGNTGTTTVTFTAQANTSTSARSAQVSVIARQGGDIITQWVTQPAAAPKVTLSDPSGSIGSANGSTASITVSATGAWSAVSDQNWVTITPASGNGTTLVTFSAQANTATTTRTAKITFTPQGGTPVTYTLTQNGQAVIPSGPVVTLSNPPGSLDSATGSTTVTVIASGNWIASSPQSWLTISPASGSSGTTTTVKFTAQANTSSSPRTATVTFGAFGSPGTTGVTYTLTQAGQTVAPTLSLTSTLGAAGPAGASATTTVTATGNWIATPTQPWVTITPASGGPGTTPVTITAGPNTDPALRTAQVLFTATGGNTVYYIFAQDPSLTVSSTTATLGGAANSSATVTVASGGAWTATPSQSWLTVTPRSGNAGTTTLTLTATANTTTSSRGAMVSLTGPGNRQLTISVTQATPPMTVSSSLVSLTSGANSARITVNSPAAWTASSDQPWLSISPASAASGNRTVTFTAVANPTTTTRTATVTFTTPGGTTTVQATQAGIPLAVSTPTLSLTGAVGSTGWETITATGAWTAKSNQSWLSLTPASGNAGQTSVALVANTANTTASTRTATVTFTGPSSSRATVTVTQAAQPVSLSSGLVSLTSAANSARITATSPGTWTASSDQSWVSISPATGASGSRTVTFTAVANPTTQARTATVTFTAPGSLLTASGSATVTITQAGAPVVVSQPTVSLTGTVGSTGWETISATGAWTAKSNQSWLNITPASGNAGQTSVALVATTANTGRSSRTATVTITGPNSSKVTVTVTQTPGA